MSQELTGFCYFHSETGTEGGFWAFQDEKFIKHNVPRGYCKKCGKWLKSDPNATIQPVRIQPLKEVLEGTERPFCKDGEHVEEISDEWSYEGMHILKTGDYLTIFSKENPEEIVWAGKIKLNEYPLFTEDAQGLWIHHDQKDVDRTIWSNWFFKGLPAKLITGERHGN